MHDKGIYIAMYRRALLNVYVSLVSALYIAMYRRALLNVYVSLVSALYCYYALIAIECKIFWGLILRYCPLATNASMSVA